MGGNLPTASTLPLGKCKTGEWYWNAKRKCVPENGVGPPPPPLPFADYKCPDYWYWGSDNYCIPPSMKMLGSYCPDKYKWNARLGACEREQ
ncbi:unnamed protein product [Rhizoctonia solani]|uniref:Uncharacterized protein n=1 Tax=Rhizoctonia solani TaxID=456999 RepID=A0A8H3HQ07_9AGAM|nr:unnamed protein product [Rhizoctonia solani]